MGLNYLGNNLMPHTSCTIDEIGNIYGKLTVISRGDPPTTTDGRATWKCECECGNIVQTLGKHLRQNRTTSCGCVQEKYPNLVRRR